MPMKSAISAAALFLLLGTIAPAYAQHEQQGKEQGKPQAQQHQPEKPAPPQHQQPAQNLRATAATELRAAPITAASGPPSPPMAASTPAASRSTKGRCAAVSSSLAPTRGIPNTAPGRSAAAITATGFLKTASGSTSGATTSSASAACRWSSWAGIHASSTTAIGLRSSIRGRKLASDVVRNRRCYILITPAMDTTCMTARTPASGSQSRSRFNQLRAIQI